MTSHPLLPLVMLISVLLLAAPSSAFDPLATHHQYDYVVLAHDSFQTEAQRLCDHRGQSLRSCVVLTSEVTAAFSGASDVEKIRNFVLYAYEHWMIAPTYLLLVGDANMVDADPPDMIDAANGNHLPAMLTYNDFAEWSGNRWFADDGWFVESPDPSEKKPIVRLGRLSVADNTQLANIVDKIIYYDGITGTPAWLGRILMLVGDGNINVNNEIYRTLNDELFDEEFSEWTPTPVTLYSQDYVAAGQWPDGATSATRSAVNTGCGFINAFGNTIDYKNLVLMAKFFPGGEPTFTQSLDATNRLPVIFTATCLSAYFYRSLYTPSGLSICEDLLFSADDRGAIALVGPTHVSDIVESKHINGVFAHMMLHDGVSNLGQLFSGTMGLCLEEESGHECLLRQYMLMGDPALDIKLHPLPAPTEIREGMEIEDAAVLQDHVSEKSGGISSENSRVVHAENGVSPLNSDRMLRVQMTDAPGAADYVEWVLLEDLELPVEQNLVLSYWINILDSPGGNDKLAIDGSTASGRIKDRVDIVDQNGQMLNAKWRSPLMSGWQFIYADLSPMHGTVLQDIRLRYETTVGTESGDLLAYIDNIRVEQASAAPPSEVMNHSFEYDSDANGTPDFWTNKIGETTTVNAIRRDDIATGAGESYMQVFDQWCNGEGAQHIFHAGPDPECFEMGFHHYAPDPTTFRVKVVDAETGAELLSELVDSSPVWSEHVRDFDNPGYMIGPRRIKIQFLPQDCAEAVYIEEVLVAEAIATGLESDLVEQPGISRPGLTSICPNPTLRGGELRVGFFLPEASAVRVRVYNVGGREVAASPMRQFGPGENQWEFLLPSVWRRSAVASGIYFAALEVNGRVIPGGEKITVVR